MARSLLVILSVALMLGLTSAFVPHTTSVVPQQRDTPQTTLYMAKRPVSLMKGKSQVVLTEDIVGTGTKDSVVTVRNGYWLNFLHPRGLAKMATSEELLNLEQRAEEIAAEQAAAEAAAVEIKDKLEAVFTYTVAKKSGETGKIYGSVTQGEVVELMKAAAGVELSSPKMTLPSINALGSYPFVVKLHPSVSAELEITVVADKGE